MNSIQNYVLESLFERNQITKEKLAQALDTFSCEANVFKLFNSINKLNNNDNIFQFTSIYRSNCCCFPSNTRRN